MNVALLGLALCTCAAAPRSGAVEGVAHFGVCAALSGRIDCIGGSAEWEARDAAIDHTARSGRTPSGHYPVIAFRGPPRAAHHPSRTQLQHSPRRRDRRQGRPGQAREGDHAAGRTSSLFRR